MASLLPNAALFALAALAELSGCYAVWAVVRLGRSPLWLIPGGLALAAFAFLLTRVDADASGRAYAAYGGIYIAMALLWIAGVDGLRPDRWDLLGGAICLMGAGVILMGPRG